MNKYEDILYINHEIKKTRMPISERASIFSPFSALTGYDELISETERIVDSKIILDEDKKNILDEKIKIIKDNLPSKVLINLF